MLKNTLKIPPKRDTFRDKLIHLVNYDNNFYDLSQFRKIVEKWSRTTKSIREWHEEYKELYNKRYNNIIEPKDNNIDKNIAAFRSKYKNYRIGKVIDKNTVKNSFPIRKNKKFMLNRVGKLNEYMEDIMFEGKYAYLVLININTRYLCVEPLNMKHGDNYIKTNTKSAKSYLTALREINKRLNRIISNKVSYKSRKIKYLFGDGESCFNSKEAWKYYSSYDINFNPVSRIDAENGKSYPIHTGLSIIDRVIRTIRDMANNLKIKMINPADMEYIVDYYNKSIHKTLSKFAKFPVSPEMVQNDIELEKHIIFNMVKDNYNKKNNSDYKLNEGQIVAVYNPKNNIIGKRRNITKPDKYIFVRQKRCNAGLFGVMKLDDYNKCKNKSPEYRNNFYKKNMLELPRFLINKI